MGIVSQMYSRRVHRADEVFKEVKNVYENAVFDVNDFSPLELDAFVELGAKLNLHRYLYYEGKLVSFNSFIKRFQNHRPIPTNIKVEYIEAGKLQVNYTISKVKPDGDKWNPFFYDEPHTIILETPLDFDFRIVPKKYRKETEDAKND